MSRHEEILLNRTLTIWLHRAFALAMFVVGVGYWMRLVGFEPGSRFDLMPVWWRMAAPTLAVLYPVAGIGLWLIAGWGAVIWVLIALVEGVMHLGFPQLFGPQVLWLGFHVWGLAMLAALRGVAWRERHRRRRR